jgi:Cellulase (glycosyl hydrolase family 5)
LRKIRCCLLILFCLKFCLIASAQQRFVHTQGKELVGPNGAPLLLRGTNLGNWFEPEGYMFQFKNGPASPREIEAFFNELIGPEDAAKFWHQYRESYITERDIQFLHETGVNSVRVPLHYELFLPGDDEDLALLDRLVAWSKAAGIYVILDLHCAPGGQTGANIDDSWNYPWLYESKEAQRQTIEVWKRLAAHYRDEPAVLGYDLLNEPIANFPEIEKYNADLEPLYREITKAIRSVDPNHVILLGGAQWDSNFSVFGPPFDQNVMYTFHKYWVAPTEQSVQPYVDFRNKYNVPIWLGESGENNDGWIAQFVQVLEKNDIGWAFWPYKKMDATSSFVSFGRPPHWDAIVAFAQRKETTAHSKERIAARPSLKDSREALQGILSNIRFESCRTNPGYIRALGLTIPK